MNLLQRRSNCCSLAPAGDSADDASNGSSARSSLCSVRAEPLVSSYFPVAIGTLCPFTTISVNSSRNCKRTRFFRLSQSAVNVSSLGNYHITFNYERLFQRSLETISYVILAGIDSIDGEDRNARSRRNADPWAVCVLIGVTTGFARNSGVRPCRNATHHPLGIELHRMMSARLY